MAKLTEILSIPVEPDLKRSIAAIAKSEERKLADVARIFLRDGVKERKLARQVREAASA